jgi:hypothetical protein
VEIDCPRRRLRRVRLGFITHFSGHAQVPGHPIGASDKGVWSCGTLWRGGAAGGVGGADEGPHSKLKIGMAADQVREIRRRPARISEVTTAAGVREQWEYGSTIPFFDNGKLVEIRQTRSAER